MSDNNNIVFNKEAKEYVPKKKKQEEETKIPEQKQQEIKENDKEKKNIEFNLNAKEFVPKNTEYQIEGLEEEADEEDDDILDELVNQELNDPIDPIPIDEEDESDDEKWFPKYKDCTCCKGYIYKCSGDVCASLGVCFCKAQEDFDPEAY